MRAGCWLFSACCVVHAAWCWLLGAWCLVRGAWCVVRGAGLGTLKKTAHARALFVCIPALENPPQRHHGSPQRSLVRVFCVHSQQGCSVDAIFDQCHIASDKTTGRQDRCKAVPNARHAKNGSQPSLQHANGSKQNMQVTGCTYWIDSGNCRNSASVIIDVFAVPGRCLMLLLAVGLMPPQLVLGSGR